MKVKMHGARLFYLFAAFDNCFYDLGGLLDKIAMLAPCQKMWSCVLLSAEQQVHDEKHVFTNDLV